MATGGAVCWVISSAAGGTAQRPSLGWRQADFLGETSPNRDRVCVHVFVGEEDIQEGGATAAAPCVARIETTQVRGVTRDGCPWRTKPKLGSRGNQLQPKVRALEGRALVCCVG